MDGLCTVCKGQNVLCSSSIGVLEFSSVYFMPCVDLFPILCTNVHRPAAMLSVFESLEQFCHVVVVFDIKQFL